MNYLLQQDGEGVSGTPVAEADQATNLAALEWAKDWLDQHANHDRYTIERADGRFAASLMQTAGGQWYAMPRIGFFSDD